ncbi:hypothetical protein [Rhizobium sp. LC145]|uniref:hypothetical protein n=1 Tax=Rhizobium sp. LC145 TaxID=1120688 RepID=UPI0010C9D29D|nr:hypothetical protein [Rhizobium sp. LC145]MDX3928014.1 hypothetical protein [Shinella sp.]TKT66155.1 hypothetical protein FDR95_06645 [Rhizobiaceae bacterium LC148]
MTIVAPVASADIRYDYDVSIGLIEHATSGEAIFIDNGAHVVRVRCQAPRMVLAGSSVFMLRDPPQVGDWKEDLWKTLAFDRFPDGRASTRSATALVTVVCRYAARS